MKVKRLEPFGALVHYTEDCTTFRLDRDEAMDLLNIDTEFPEELTAPEIVHIELTSRCNKNCEYCYVDREESCELSCTEWKELIDELIENKVFQITFGGGEPLLAKDKVIELSRYIDDKPMNLAMTTNGTVPMNEIELDLFDQVNVSHHGSIKEIDRAVKEIKDYTEAGINYLLNYDTIRDLPEAVRYSKKNDVELLILSYKPVNNDWEKMIPPSTVYDISKYLSNFGVKIAVDMFTKNTCTGNDKFCTIDPSGNVFPCSFVRKSMGNVMEKSFKEVWRKRFDLSCPYLINCDRGNS